MDLKKSNKVAIVTGNGHGIGLAISEILRKEGYIVPVIDKPEYDLMQDGIQKLMNDYPECEILVNNVGGMGRSKQEDWKDCMQKNYGIAFELTMYYIPKMKNGKVITISSICALDNSGLPWFNAAKSAQISLNKSLVGKYDATFNTICPDKVNVKPEEAYKLNPEDIAIEVYKLINSNRNNEVIEIR